MTDFVRGSSSFTRLEVHVCYKTRYCKKVFDFIEIKQRCEEIFREVAAELRIDIKEIGFNRDHVHMDLVHPPMINVCEISKRFKGRSGRRIKEEFPFLKKRPWFWGKNSGFWGEQLFGDSVGRDPEIIRNYVKNQGFARKEISIMSFLKMNTTSL